MPKVIVAGSRTFDDYPLMVRELDRIRLRLSSMTIVSGTARGADQLGERYAKQTGLEVIRMPADWDTYGKSAGYRRNERMASIADICIVFWNGVSRGTQHMINIAREYELFLIVVNTDTGLTEEFVGKPKNTVFI